MTGTAPDAERAKRRARTGPAPVQVTSGDPIHAVDGRMPGIMGLGGSSTREPGAGEPTDLTPVRLTEGFYRARIWHLAELVELVRDRRAGGVRGWLDQPAYKPGSVRPERSRAPTWRPFLWDGRCRPPRATNPGDWPGERACPSREGRAAPIRSCSRWGLPCRPRCRVRGALLPHPFTLTPDASGAVCSLWHCPWGRPRRTLSGTVSPWSPDFPPRTLMHPERPPGRLIRGQMRPRRRPGQESQMDYQLPVFSIDVQGSCGSLAAPFCRISIEMPSGDFTKAM